MAHEFLNYIDPTENYSDNINSIIDPSIAPYPLTMNIWFNTTTTGAGSLSLCGIGTRGPSSHSIRVNLANGRLQGVTKSETSGTTSIATSTGHSSGQWNMTTYVITSSTARKIILNSNVSNTTTVSRVLQNLDHWVIGGYYEDENIVPSFEGKLAEFAIWEGVLSDSEIVSLYRGMKANQIKPELLRVYVPLVRDIIDYSGVIDQISFPSGATVTSHPKRYG